MDMNQCKSFLQILAAHGGVCTAATTGRVLRESRQSGGAFLSDLLDGGFVSPTRLPMLHGNTRAYQVTKRGAVLGGAAKSRVWWPNRDVGLLWTGLLRFAFRSTWQPPEGFRWVEGPKVFLEELGRHDMAGLVRQPDKTADTVMTDGDGRFIIHAFPSLDADPEVYIRRSIVRYYGLLKRGSKLGFATDKTRAPETTQLVNEIAGIVMPQANAGVSEADKEDRAQETEWIKRDIAWRRQKLERGVGLGEKLDLEEKITDLEKRLSILEKAGRDFSAAHASDEAGELSGFILPTVTCEGF